MSKIKVCFFSPNALPLIENKNSGFGGAELDLWQLAEQLSKDENFQVYFVVSGEENKEIEFNKIKIIVIEKYKPFKLKRGYFSRYLMRIIFKLRGLKADIYFYKGASLEAILCFFASKIFLRKKFIYRFQHDWETNIYDLEEKMFSKNKFLSKLFLFLLKRSDLVITQTNFQKEAVLKNYNLNSKTIYNAHLILPKPEIKNKKFILWVGRLTSYKRPEIFLELARRLPEERFIIIGALDPNFPKIAKLIKEESHKIKNLIFIPGLPKNEIEKYFIKAKLFILTSESEGFPNVFTEASKTATPTISLKVDPDNLIKRFSLGGVANDNFEELVIIVKKFLSNQNLLEKTAINVYNFAKENFNIEETIKVYKELFWNLKNEKKIKKFAKEINRQRIKSKIWDYSYILLKNNLEIFKKFRDLVIKGKNSRILDVGCGFKPWLELFDKSKIEYIGLDFDKEKSSADFIASADKLPFPDNNFDALIYSEALEHVENLPQVLKELRRVVKNDAFVFISSPFIFPEHGIPYDFQRLTRYFYQNIFKKDKIVLIKESNSSLSTTVVLFNLFIESTPFRIFIGLKHLIYILNNIIAIIIDNITNFIFSRIGRSYKIYFYLMPLGYALIVQIKK